MAAFMKQCHFAEIEEPNSTNRCWEACARDSVLAVSGICRLTVADMYSCSRGKVVLPDRESRDEATTEHLILWMFAGLLFETQTHRPWQQTVFGDAGCYTLNRLSTAEISFCTTMPTPKRFFPCGSWCPRAWKKDLGGCFLLWGPCFLCFFVFLVEVRFPLGPAWFLDFFCYFLYVFVFFCFVGFIGFIGFSGFIGFFGFVGFVGFFGLVGLVGFVGFLALLAWLALLSPPAFLEPSRRRLTTVLAPATQQQNLFQKPMNIMNNPWKWRQGLLEEQGKPMGNKEKMWKIEGQPIEKPGKPIEQQWGNQRKTRKTNGNITTTNGKTRKTNGKQGKN